MAKLLLKKDGSLMRTVKEETYDVSDVAWAYLNDDITFEEGITFGDLFRLISKNIDTFTVIFGNWIDEYKIGRAHV